MLSALFVSAALAFTEADADFAFSCASNLVVSCTPRDAGTAGGRRAAGRILDMVRGTGADVRLDPFKARARGSDGGVSEREFTNVYAMFGTTPEAPWVVFVSHYDTKPGTNCPGANDGASTSGLMISLASAIERRGRSGTANVMLAWLDGEECVRAYGEDDGLRGSRRLAEQLQRRETNVRAVICLDMLGDRMLDITIPSNGSPTLMKIAKVASHRAEVPVSLVAETMRDDHVPFLELGYPAIDLIDFDYGSSSGCNDWWHTPHDTVDKLSAASLLKSGRLVAELLDILSR